MANGQANNAGGEQRKYERRLPADQVGQALTVSTLAGSDRDPELLLSARIINLSYGGLAFSSSEKMDEGSWVRLEFSPDPSKGSLAVDGQIVRASPPILSDYQYGVQFSPEFEEVASQLVGAISWRRSWWHRLWPFGRR